jgi:hypothetical protein
MNTNPVSCRRCGKSNEDQTYTGSVLRVPHDGDWSLCGYCGLWSVFDGGALREPTPDEADEIATNPEAMEAARIVAQIAGGPR